MVIEFEGTEYSPIGIYRLASNATLQEEAEKLKDKYEDCGACVLNSYLTGQATGATCIEGFVACKKLPLEFSVIRHCWNKIDNQNYDVTLEYIWSKTNDGYEYFYYPIAEYYALDYDQQLVTATKPSFLSDAVRIAAGVGIKLDKMIDELNKQK